jgi:hypothetical protein
MVASEVLERDFGRMKRFRITMASVFDNVVLFDMLAV